MKKTGKGNNKDMRQKNSFKVRTNLKQFKKQTKGITLIALVITIIVLLILAAVTIATLTGDNGILTRASDASERTAEANAREQVQLAVQGSYDETGKINIDDLNTELSRIDGLTYNGSPVSESNKIPALPVDVELDGYTITIHADGSVTVGDNAGGGTETGETVVDGVTIPEGFYYVDGTKDTGIVISDVEGDDLNNSKQGNQFVWVPVDDYSEFVRRAGYWNGSEQSLTNYGEADSTGNNTNSGITETAATQTEAQAMYASVKENGGFYIGRYEAGRDSDGNVVVKKGVDVYTNIPWSASGSMQETNEITGGAVELARNFDTANNYTNVTSTLIYGVQWDAVMKWMENIENPNVEGKTYIQDSTGMGWYSDNSGYAVHQTGIDVDSNKSNCVNNIYDLAGNVYEWTMESCYTSYRVSRGGVCNFTGSNHPASGRYSYCSPSSSNDLISFCLTLYL